MTNAQYWRDRYAKQGRDYVAHIGLRNFEKQREIITETVRSWAPRQDTDDLVLDFGCGVGRFASFLRGFGKYLHGVDYVDSLLPETRMMYTRHIVQEHLPLPIVDETYSLIWSCTVLQHITDDALFAATCRELYRVAAPGCCFLLVENAKDQAAHVVLRTADEYVTALGIQLAARQTFSVDYPGSHQLIVGYKSTTEAGKACSDLTT